MNERIDQTGDDLKMTLTGNNSPSDGQTFYVGKYTGNPNTGKTLETNPAGVWTDAPIKVIDPDHIQDVRSSLIIVRTPDPGPDDAPCDTDNSSRTQSDYAFQRGRASLNSGGPPAKAECWFHTAAMEGHAKSQGILGMMLHDGAPGVRQDYGEAFNWLKKGAEGGDY
jgi:TPR repeat protein